ncbi:hypothetical protein CISG_07000 [Coccidioides immitis RMSCC 3703]|uniref:Uncharacterized protein n=1 Tax=Coccidioides immitis RMSCC 3703 TaxID=454286 RepID=A0A0J8R1G6_COCIT|nr:hypothetical protein CISG_07000 [Coccidioides immitis RMSCC 3703]
MGGVETLSQSRELLEPRCGVRDGGGELFGHSCGSEVGVLFKDAQGGDLVIRLRKNNRVRSIVQPSPPSLSEMDFELKGQPPTAVILERAEPSLAGSPNFQAAPIILDLVILPYGVHELRTRAGQP